jgi:type IV pilus assembly protein PilX
MALVSSLLLLLVMTILGVAMFRSFGTLERIAGNTREKERALHAATSAQTYAEWFLASAGGVNATAGTNCTAFVTAPTNVQVCSNTLASASTIPWGAGVNYVPPGMSVGGTAGIGTADNYVAQPGFYISYLGGSYVAPTRTSSYQIDAVGYGGSNNAVAVAESTYNVSVTYTSQGPPPPGKNPKVYINHGGP